MGKSILIVEDEQNIVDILSFNLSREGYDTLEAYDGPTGLQLALEQDPDLILLDLMLPGMDGFEVCRQVRESGSSTPIIMLTAREEETDKVLGLELGADDYMTKPFSVLELLARVRSLLRRAKEEEPEQLKLFDCGALHLDLETREVKVNGREVLLTYKEYELLVYLAENQNRVVSRDELLDKLWDWRADVETRTLDIHIKTLRQKLGEEAGHYIKTVRSVGYRFMKPQE